jgi:signal transduction histidine kinase
MSKLASKSAGQMLAVILLVLLLPMMLIGYFYISTARKEISGLQRELLGSKLLQQVYGVYLTEDLKPTDDQLKVIRELEGPNGLNFSGRFEQHLAEELKGLQNFDEKLKPSDIMRETVARSANQNVTDHQGDGVTNYMVDIGTKSGLLLDSDPASYFIATAVVEGLPQVIASTQSVSQAMKSLAKSRDNYDQKLMRVSLLLGSAFESHERLHEALNRSLSYSADASGFDKIENAERDLEKAILAMAEEAESASDKNALANYLNFMHVMQASQTTVEVKNRVWVIAGPSFAELDQKISQRLQNAKWQLWTLSAIGVLAGLMGLGLAIFMFKRTLGKLDEVETSRETALQAKAETDRINEDVALLNRDLADKVLKLQEAQGEIVKKGRMEQLGQLTATIAHELRNPLGSVRTSAFLIGKKVAGKELGLETQVARIENGVARCDSIITQLLDYSRTKQLSLTEGNLDNWLVNIVSEEAAKLPQNIQVECVLGLDNALVPFDPSRLQRAIVNLVSNAAEAMVGKENSAPIQATAHPQLWVSTFTKGHLVGIRVMDNGPGITPENLTKIREPLYTTKSFGTGLGIPAIEQIASQHRGHLDITSVPGQGAEFTVYLPRYAQQDAA